MNISEKVKFVWWASMRCGSRSVSEIIKHYEFYNYQTKQNIWYSAHTHEINVPEEFLNYKILMQVRNPYSRALSMWHLYGWKNIDGINGTLQIESTFEEYVFKGGFITDHYERGILKYKPQYFIRYENLSEDVLKIPFVNLDSNQNLKLDYNRSILENVYLNEGVEKPEGALKRDSKDKRYADWRSYYNKKIADKVYELCAPQFELLNYDKNSWKT